MTGTDTTIDQGRGRTAETWIRTFRDRPVLPLVILLAILVVAFIGLNPRTNVSEWIASTLRAAVPLAILAGCQTLVRV